jgi:hypothetical protein
MAVDYRIRLCFPAAAALPSRWALWSSQPDIPFTVLRGDPALPPALVAEHGAARVVGIYEWYT